MVVPSEMEPVTPKASETISLSSFDKRAGPFPVTLLLAYDRPIHEPVETIKISLSRALAHYQPIAGRLNDGGAAIVCTGEGVLFVGARASCALEELVDKDDAAPLKDLAIGYPSEPCRESDPLLLVQVTEFICGGFVIGVVWNHVIADGAGMAQFLQAVGELSRGVSPPSVLPARRWDDSLPGLPPSMATAQKPSSMVGGLLGMVRHDMTIPWSVVNDIKAAGFGSGGETCTAFEAIAAVLWRCRTRAALSGDDPNYPAPLYFPCNLRALVGAAAGYYGNCVVVQAVPATSGEVANSTIGELVRRIRLAKEKVPDLLRPSSDVKSNDDGEPASNSSSGDRGEADGRPAQNRNWMYNVLTLLSWRNLGFEAANFGSGGASRVMWHGEPMVPSFVACPPRKGRGDDGVSVSSMCVKPEHADAFLGELAKLTASN
ncbi:3'-N-debenzoyl-2'-deoxytaxol N-benzoyltransferase [Dichanthelium oligosanthes]|uniref:3'-N-debenzoyl-2'-deoxytaxol N-benzoyltransferase n=1 Tax=Dichanthelium oligosanthes TaxID=888268 RepID=A0A1E5VE12_9POAL|nr:3'-N-debenzoyl-2'-deoxytaxol N-benzoyltransferase [Dichanthelium oligosanthes]